MFVNENIRIILISALALVQLSCEKDSGNDRSIVDTNTGGLTEDSTQVDATTESVTSTNNADNGDGCVQGVIIDGYTGQPIPFKSLTEDLFVMIRNKKFLATAVDDSNFVGQYFLCGVPLDETYPIYGFFPGYQTFESSVHIKSTAEAVLLGEGGVLSHVKKKDPLLIANVVLFPKSVGDRNLSVLVTNEGVPVAGAIVDIEASQSDSNHFTNTVSGAAFIYSNGTRNFTTRVVTDSQGVATIPGSEMAMGHPYGLTVTPSQGQNLTASTSKFIFGINGPELTPNKSNYEYLIDLAVPSGPLKIISCSMQNSTFTNDSSIWMVFNRDIIPVGQNGWTTALWSSTATVATNVPTNSTSEQVNGTVVNGNTLVLTTNFSKSPKTPDYTQPEAADVNVDRNTIIQYRGVKVSVVGDNTQNSMLITAVDPDKLCESRISANWFFYTRMFREYQ
jgi:hypothetical protein